MAFANQPSKQDLKRQYREQRPVAGVFTITNRQNNKVLLGSSKNLHGPLNKHRFALTCGGHSNGALQSDWNTFGEAAFVLEIVARVEPHPDSAFELDLALERLEQHWLEKLRPLTPNGYNTNLRVRE